MPFLDGATVDYVRSATGGELTIRAPALRGTPPDENASLVERVRYVIESEVNPQLASHGGRVSLREVTAEGVVVLQFGGGCHGCGMVDVTLRNGVERTLKVRVPGVTGVADATDHATGEQAVLHAGSGGGKPVAGNRNKASLVLIWHQSLAVGPLPPEGGWDEGSVRA